MLGGMPPLKLSGRLNALNAIDVALPYLAGEHDHEKLIIALRRLDDCRGCVRHARVAQEPALRVIHPRGRGDGKCECLFHIYITVAQG